MIPARHPSKLDIEPVACSVSLCGKLATIIHGEKAYCGEHALKQLNAGARLKDIPVGDPGQRPRSNQAAVDWRKSGAQRTSWAQGRRQFGAPHGNLGS